jgi:hypothetical protein
MQMMLSQRLFTVYMIMHEGCITHAIADGIQQSERITTAAQGNRAAVLLDTFHQAEHR